MAETSSTVALNDSNETGLMTSSGKNETSKATYAGIDAGLNIFSPQLTEKGVIKDIALDFFPLATIQKDKPIDFHIPYTNPYYLDLSKSTIRLKVRIVREDGTPIDKDDKVAFVNNILHTLFNKVDLVINGKLTSPDVGVNFPYQQMMQILTSYPVDFLQASAGSQGFTKDTANFISSPTASVDGENQGHFLRSQWTQEGQYLSLEACIGHDLCYMNCYLPSSLPVNWRFWPSNDNFALLSASAMAENYKYQIAEMSIRMHAVHLTEQVISRHEARLASKMAVFHYPRSEIKTFTIPSGQVTYAINNLYSGTLPYDTYIGCVKTSSYIGSRTTSPFEFSHFGLRQVSLYIPQHQEMVYNLSFKENEYDYVNAYRNLYTTDSGTRFTPGIITLDDFPGGYSLIRFRLSTADTVRENRVKQGTGRLTFTWDAPLIESVTVIVFNRFHDSIYMDANRNIWLTEV